MAESAGTLSTRLTRLLKILRSLTVPRAVPHRCTRLELDHAIGRYLHCLTFVGHRRRENTVRYLGIDVDDALEMTEQTEV